MPFLFFAIPNQKFEHEEGAYTNICGNQKELLISLEQKKYYFWSQIVNSIISIMIKSLIMGTTRYYPVQVQKKSQVRYEKITEKVIQFKIPPEILEKLRLLEEQKKDPTKVIKAQNQMKALICSSLEKETFPTKFSQKRVVFLGRTSTGKSSLINKLFGTKLKVAAGSCTSQIKQAITIKGVKVYDVPGFDSKFDLTSDYNLMVESLGQINAAYILFNSVKDVEDLIKILLAMKRQVYGIRTQCDNIDSDCQLSLEQEIIRDKKEFRQLGVSNPVIFATSKKGGFDNEKLILHIIA